MKPQLKNQYQELGALDKANKISETFCIYPFTLLFVGSGGTPVPCCISEHHHYPIEGDGKDQDGHYIIPTESIKGYWNSKALERTRKNMLEGKKDPGCSRCWVDEKNGQASKRISDIDKIPGANFGTFNTIEEFKEHVIKRPKILWIDLQMANLCNMACRMCNPWNSSEIEREALLYKDELSKDDAFRKRWVDPLEEVKIVKDYWRSPEFNQELQDLIPTLEVLTVSGGEPTVNKYFNNIIDFCIENDYAKNLVLKFNTNAQQINRKYMDKLKPFKFVEMKVSMDGTGTVFDYIRHLGKWETCSKNRLMFEEYRSELFDVNSDPTYQILNILNLPELLQWHLDNNLKVTNLNPVHVPEFYNITCLPKEIRKVAYDKLYEWTSRKDNEIESGLKRSINNVLLHLQAEDLNYQRKWFPKFIKHTATLDKMRGQSFKEMVPELYDLLKQYGY